MSATAGEPSAAAVTAPPTPSTLRRIVELAGRAPSVHNTQPWTWRTTATGLELRADRRRRLRVEDPVGRNLVISCGTALHHAEVAARALGWEAEISRTPHGPASTLLARVDLVTPVVPEDPGAVIDAILQRCTDRRRFTSWPVPEERLQLLAALARERGVQATPLLEVTGRFRTELLVAQALDVQSADQLIRREQASWVNHGARDGVPSAVLPMPSELSARRANRFSPGLLGESDAEVEQSDGLIVLCSRDDETEAWLRAGEGLSALWLHATVVGLSIVPLSQVVEVPRTRAGLQQEVLGGLGHPQLLVRVGWQPISRSELPRTERRPVDEVLDPV